MLKSLKVRLELNNIQRSLCEGHAGLSRLAYNKGLAYCKERYELKQQHPSAIDLHKWFVSTFKKENKWVYNYSKCSPQQAFRDLDVAYKTFFKSKKGFPKFKKKGIRDSFYLEGNIQVNDNRIKIPKFGWVKTSEQLPNVPIKNVTISKRANEWYISFKYEFTPQYTIKKIKSVGVDLGIKTLATLSNGEIFNNLKPYKNAKRKLRKAQKSVSRKYIKGAESQSSNYKKCRIKLAKIHKKVSDVRIDGLHKLTTYLSKNFETVVIEDLNVKGITKNHNLASAILDGGFYEFKRQLLYKKEWYGGSVILANRFYPSSKLCSCGVKNDELKLSDRNWTCKTCGLVNDRDLLASRNLNKLAVSSTATAFGGKSSTPKGVQLTDELGMKHKMFAFV